jgi:hypothetical protein
MPAPPGLSLGEHGEALASELFRRYVVAGSTAIPEGYLNDFLNRHGLSLRLSSQGHDIVVQLGRSADGLVMDPPSIPDGYLKALALFHLLDMRPSLLLVDELENSLHLKLLELAMSAFRSSGTKVVVTTHSPMVVDLADPSELVMLSLSEGATVARRVQHPHEVPEGAVLTRISPSTLPLTDQRPPLLSMVRASSPASTLAPHLAASPSAASYSAWMPPCLG